jgi:dTDP-4-dehydrorhamnose reductase
MKILILGAKGMLGQELVKAFADMGEVAAWDRSVVDMAKADELSGKITAFMPDILLNAAAYNNMDKAEGEGAEEAKAMNSNVVGALADMCQILAITLVHFSTDYVFDGTKADGYAETEQPNPISVYGETKYLGERLLRMSGAEYYLVRTSRLFGHPGASPGAKKSFVDTMLELAKTKTEISLVADEVASPTYVVDLARAVRRLFDEKRPFGIYHITNSGSCSWYEYGKKVFSLAGVQVAVTAVPGSSFPRPAKRPAYSVLQNTKLPELRSWQEALQEYLRERE